MSGVGGTAVARQANVNPTSSAPANHLQLTINHSSVFRQHHARAMNAQVQRIKPQRL